MKDWNRVLFRRIPGKWDFPYAINRELDVRYIDGKEIDYLDVENGKVELSKDGVLDKYDVKMLWKDTANAWRVEA